MNEPESIKVVLVGESGVGKTSIIQQFTSGQFDPHRETSLSAQFVSKTVKIKELDKEIKFDIWDTVGQEKYRSLAKIFYKDAKAIIFVYDITTEYSFNELKNYWYEETKANSDGNPILALVGNKIDLYESQKVSNNEGNDFAEKIGAIFQTTSAQSNSGIDTLFDNIGKKYLIPNYDYRSSDKKAQEEFLKKKEEENNKKDLNSDEELDEYLQKISGIIPQKTKEKNKETNIIKGSNLNIKESRFLIEEENFHNNLPDEKNTNIDLDEFGENENIFNETVPLNLTYDWSEKYTPIKPRYSNRVRVGYEWNKYNQVHYNIDNPPPKIIQGYKFNIFYPSLIDKTKTPTYFLERGDALDMCIIRFHAGAPYEDIAFKIVNREWDMTEKAAFKNIFDKGILKLYFKFKRYRYKR